MLIQRETYKNNRIASFALAENQNLNYSLDSKRVTAATLLCWQ